MRVHDSALKHGIDLEDAVYAATWPIWTDELDEDSPARQLRLGFDTRGRLLETVVLVFERASMNPRLGRDDRPHALLSDGQRRALPIRGSCTLDLG